MAEEIERLRQENRLLRKQISDRDHKTKQRKATRKRRNSKRQKEKKRAFQDALALASDKIEQQATKRIKALENEIDELKAAKTKNKELRGEIMNLDNELAEK